MATWRSQLAVGIAVVGRALLAALLLFALWSGTRDVRTAWLAERFRETILTAPDHQVETLLREAAGLGEVALPLLAESLGSYRTSVATAAHRVLNEELENWADLPADEAGRRVAGLSAALAEYVPLYGSRGRSWAAEIVERLIRWPLPRERFDHDTMLLHCSAVLQATTEMRSRADWDAQQAALQLDPLRQVSRPHTVAPEADAALARAVEESHLPGGGVPVQPASVRAIPAEPFPATSPAHEETARRPQPLVLPDASPLVEEPAPLERKPERIADPLVEPVAGNQGAVVQQSRRLSDEELAQSETLSLIHLLRSSPSETLARIEAELRRRGMHDEHLHLARQLASPDVEVRRQLASDLPRLPGIDAQPWLLWLLKDESAEVRHTAFTILATASDLHLRPQLIQLGRQDADPKIRALAEKLSSERR